MPHPTDFMSALLLLGAITADYTSVASTVCASASILTTKVKRWTREDGIAGVIDIEGDLTELASTLCALSESAYGVSSVDIDSAVTMSVVNSIVDLLDALAEKADDFKAVGATNTVAHSLELLQEPSQSIVGELISALSHSPKGGALRPCLSSLEMAVNTVNPAYGIPPVHFPTLFV